MALLQDDPKISTRALIFIGIPSFLFATVVSLLIHRQAHEFGGAAFCPDAGGTVHTVSFIMNSENSVTDCGMSALAAQVTTLGLAIVSFALFLRYPRNMFLMSMAFVNASTRLPESVTVFLQYLIHNETSLQVDESASLSLIGLSDPAIPTVIICFYTIILLFFSIIVVHDVRAVRFKWAVAAGLFVGLGYVEAAIGTFLDSAPLA